MYYILHLVDMATSALAVWSPVKLLAAAAITILLGYLGIVSRLATR
jgi:hypothetical protein